MQSNKYEPGTFLTRQNAENSSKPSSRGEDRIKTKQREAATAPLFRLSIRSLTSQQQQHTHTQTQRGKKEREYRRIKSERMKMNWQSAAAPPAVHLGGPSPFSPSLSSSFSLSGSLALFLDFISEKKHSLFSFNQLMSIPWRAVGSDCWSQLGWLRRDVGCFPGDWLYLR